MALRLGKKFAPILLDDTELPVELAKYQAIDMRDFDPHTRVARDRVKKPDLTLATRSESRPSEALRTEALYLAKQLSALLEIPAEQGKTEPKPLGDADDPIARATRPARAWTSDPVAHTNSVSGLKTPLRDGFADSDSANVQTEQAKTASRAVEKTVSKCSIAGAVARAIFAALASASTAWILLGFTQAERSYTPIAAGLLAYLVALYWISRRR